MLAEIVTVVRVDTALVLTEKPADDPPVPIVTLLGTDATPGELLDKEMEALVGAGPFSDTFPVTDPPPTVDEGLRDSDEGPMPVPLNPTVSVYFPSPIL